MLVGCQNVNVENHCKCHAVCHSELLATRYSTGAYASIRQTGCRIYLPIQFVLSSLTRFSVVRVFGTFALRCLKAMCHTDVEARMVTNWFPYFLPTSLFFSSKRSRLLFSYLLPTITCFALSRRTNWLGEIRETVSFPWELRRRYATLP